MLMHGWMQNSNCNNSGSITGNRVHRTPSGISQTLDLLWNFLDCGWSHFCSVAPLVVPETNLSHGLPATWSMRDIATGSVWLITSKSQIQIHTYRRDKPRAILSSTDSTILVVRVWKKLWPVIIGRIWDSTSKPLKSNSISGISRGRHPRHCWFSKMPDSLAREICWLNAGRIPQGRISVKTLHIARILLGSSDGDSCIELQLMGYQIGVAGINLRE